MTPSTEQIHAVADQIVQDGKHPTFTAVLEAVGGGSATTVIQSLKTWISNKTDEDVLDDEQVPAAITDLSKARDALFWKEARTAAERRLQIERNEVAAAKKYFWAKEAEYLEVIEMLEAKKEAEAEEREARIKFLENEVVERDARIKFLEDEDEASADLAESLFVAEVDVDAENKAEVDVETKDNIENLVADAAESDNSTSKDDTITPRRTFLNSF